MTIPASELAPGFVRAAVEGIDGEVYVNAAEAAETCTGSFRQPPFPPEYRHIFENLAEVFRDVYPNTPEGWEDGFRHDLHPEGEIRKWCKMAAAFQTITAGKKLSMARKGDYFDIILSVFTNGPALALEMVELAATSQAEARRIVRQVAAGFLFE